MTKLGARQAEAQRSLDFLGDGLKDYLAARVLLNSELTQQGAVLSSTALEKYFKALLLMRGTRIHGHLQKAHWNAVRNFYPSFFSTLDLEFLELCRAVYALRYTDALSTGFNVVVATREFLAELDQTVFAIEDGISMIDSGQAVTTHFRRLRDEADTRLFDENHVLLGHEKLSHIYGRTQFVIEVRKHPQYGLLEIQYSAGGLPKRSGFLRPACLPLEADGKVVGLDLAFGDHDV